MTSDLDLGSMNYDVAPEVPPEPAPELENGAEADAKAAALAAIAKLQANIGNAPVETNGGAAAGPPVAAIKVEDEEKPKPERKKRFGPPANAPREVPKKKRKTRWERSEPSTSSALIVQNRQLWPTDVTLPGGVTVSTLLPCHCPYCPSHTAITSVELSLRICLPPCVFITHARDMSNSRNDHTVWSFNTQVVLPPHLTGRKMSDDPQIQSKYEELWRTEDDIREGKVEIPPEGERSPSPPPIYDRFGIRQNTREFRYREKLLDKRGDLIEDLIKADKAYQPPTDYRPRKKHRKIFIPYKEYPGYNFIGAHPFLRQGSAVPPVDCILWPWFPEVDL